jgi:2-hydroxychromene-2-carboxylate isomerase
MRRGAWYFDFISPFAYLHSRQLDQLDGLLELEPRPVLFAAMLEHWGQKGPAEIPGKRLYTFRYVTWLARRRRIEMRMPASHPFNPLPYLRLALAAGCRRDAIDAIFAAVFTTGHDPASADVFRELGRTLGFTDPESDVSAPAVKDTLRANTAQAIGAGVFGVPTIVVDGQLFWGEESLPMLRDYLENPAAFDEAEMRRAAAIAPSAVRGR